ncbi:MAG: NAD(+)/NADH kinase [Chloroflexi bacterium]|nr:MAG: NAD(+)/NADH kinase [Chloroflexota bacterium]MBL1196273.1 NAD(+)/NADH kinase [Chloroflexota bacterium]NOH13568.1 NAD(+)/NADH kinase [Chloroflexota bacterium]
MLPQTAVGRYNEIAMSVENTFKRVAVIAHPDVAQASEEAKKVCAFLEEHGVEAVHAFLHDEELREQIKSGSIDLAITLGGDGTVLRAGHLCAPYDVPILAINYGRFGFLIEVGRDQWPETLPKLFNGNFWYEQRMMLRTEQWRRDSKLGEWDVLNEVFVGRGELVRPVHLVTSLDGDYLTTYVADGLIVSSATGSTAYALAAGGPILPPELRNLLLIAVAPHLSIDRAIVVAEGATINIVVRTGHDAVLNVDGRPSVILEDGDSVTVRASDYNVRLLRFQDPAYFYRQLFRFMDQNPSAGIAQ